jgi:hypothetical protein
VVTTAAISKIVNAIFINSPMKKVIGVAPFGLRTLIANRKAKKAFGSAQLKPPNNAESPAGIPNSKNAISAAMKAVANCNRTMRAMWFPSELVKYSGLILLLFYLLFLILTAARNHARDKTTELYVLKLGSVKR